MAKYQPTPSKIRRYKNTSYKKRISNVYARSFNAHIVTDAESKANHNLVLAPDTLAVTQFPVMLEKTYHTKASEYNVCKNGVTPSFSDLTKESRTLILTVLMSAGNIPSRLLTVSTGMLARQVGQIRRWHIQNWKTLTPNRIINY